MLPVYQEPRIIKIYCFDCESRFEEEVYEEVDQTIFCISCKSENILPFAECVDEQEGCSSNHCQKRVCDDGEIVDCGGCNHGCSNTGGGG